MDGNAAAGWDVRQDEASGQVYYWNAITGETSWDPPPHLASALLPPWTEVYDENGGVYYLNVETMETRWTPPSTAAGNQAEGAIASDVLAMTGGIGRRPSTAEQMNELNRLLSGEVDDDDESSETEDAVDPHEPSSYSNVTALQTSENTLTDGNGCPWMMFINESDGLPYYYNHATGECLWEPPEEFLRFHQEQAQQQESGEMVEGSGEAAQPAVATSQDDPDAQDLNDEKYPEAARANNARPKSGSLQVVITPEFEEKVRRAIAAVSNTPMGSSRVMLVRTPTEQQLIPRTGRSVGGGVSARSAGGSARSAGGHSRPPSGGAVSRPRPPSAGAISSRLLGQDPAASLEESSAGEKFIQEKADATESGGGGGDGIHDIEVTPLQPLLVKQTPHSARGNNDSAAVSLDDEAQLAAAKVAGENSTITTDIITEITPVQAEGQAERAAEPIDDTNSSIATTERPGGIFVEPTATGSQVNTGITLEQPGPHKASAIENSEAPQVNDTTEGPGIVSPNMKADLAALIVQCLMRCFIARQRLKHQRERRHRVSMLDAVEFSPDSAVLAGALQLEPLPANLEEDDELVHEVTNISQLPDGKLEEQAAIFDVLPVNLMEPRATDSVSEDDIATKNAPTFPDVFNSSLQHTNDVDGEIVKGDSSSVPTARDTKNENAPSSKSPIFVVDVQPPEQDRVSCPTRLPSVLDVANYFPPRRSAISAYGHRESTDTSAAPMAITRKKIEVYSPPRVRHLSQQELEKMEARHQENLEARRKEEEQAQRAQVIEYQRIYAESRQAFKLEKQRILREKLERDNQREHDAEVEKRRREAARLQAKHERDEERAHDRVVGDDTNPLLWELIKAPDRPTTYSMLRFQNALTQVLDSAQFADKMCAERARELQQRIDQMHRASWAVDSQLESLELRILSELHPLTDQQRPLQAKYVGKLRCRLERILNIVQYWQRVLDEWESGNGDLSTTRYWGAIHAHYLPSSAKYSSDESRRQCVLKDWRGAAGGDSLLHAAAWNGWEEHTSFLVEQGADVNLVDSSASHRTPLHDACRAGHALVVQILLDSGARVTAIDSSGDSALHIACRGGWTRVVRILMVAAKNREVKASETAANTLLSDREPTNIEKSTANLFVTVTFFNLRNGKGARAIDVATMPSLMEELEQYDGQLNGSAHGDVKLLREKEMIQKKRKQVVAGS